VSVEPRTRRHGVRVIRVTGEVDVVSARSMEDALAPDGPLVLDLADVTFFDSSGLRLVDRLARSHAQQGSGFRVVAPPGSRTRRVLDIVGLGTGLVADDVDAAVDQLRRTQSENR
jgi:anti-anti-sigma factor